MKIEKFEDIDSWKKARALVKEIYSHLSSVKDYGFRDQIQRAALSILLIMAFIILISLLITSDLLAKEIPKGYLIIQCVETYNISKFGAISTPEEAEKIFSNIKEGNIGIEFYPIFYSKTDIDKHYQIAKVSKKYKIDLWASSFKLIERIRAFGEIKPEHQAYVMNEDGEIIPAMVEGKPLFDVLNEDAVTWFLKEYREKYLEKMKGLINGYFFNEDLLRHIGKFSNDRRPDYRNNPTYSLFVLNKWREYCRKHNIVFNGEVVSKFPVHDPKMVAKGNGLTKYYPGYEVPEKVIPGQKFTEMLKSEGVWKHWFDFICELFINNWIGRIAKEVSDINKNNPIWYGIVYFGLHTWSLPYEEIESDDFTVPAKHRWGAWGRQLGLDLKMLSCQPNIDFIVCETYPPISANLEYFIREYKRIVEANGKMFGLMLHRDDKWKIDLAEEEKRWDLINKYKPIILVRYPLKHTFNWNDNYFEEGENYFYQKLDEYRKDMYIGNNYGYKN
jgi:hypothetical protein